MATTISRSFAAGELAPSLYGRADLFRYQTGLRTCRNFIIARHGGAYNRPGTTFAGEVKDSTKSVRLVPFIFSLDQTYVLEFGNLYMRVYRNGAQVTFASQAITNITNANPAVLTYGGADTYANGDEVFVSGVVGPISQFVNGRNFRVVNVNVGANTFELDYLNGDNVDSTAFGAYTSGGTIAEVFEIATPYVEADLPELAYAQSADIVTLVHPSYDPRELSRTAHTAWTLAVITFTPSIAAPAGPAAVNGTAGAIVWRYQVTTVRADTYEESLPTASFSTTGGLPTQTNPNTLSWTAVVNAVSYNVYRETTPGSGTYGFIGTASTVAFADSNINPDGADTPPISRNPFSGADNRPSTVTYFQQRRTFANTNNNPETVYASRSGARNNMTISQPLQDDDAVTFTLAGQQVNEIRHLRDLGKLLVFTSGGEWVIEGDAAGVLTPVDINARQRSYNGSTTLPPLLVNETALYVQARGAIIRDLGFDYTVDGYRGNDLTIFSAHLFEGFTLRDWAYQQIPHSIVWCVRSDGTLLGLTYIREHQVVGWHRHDTDGIIEQVCVVPEGSEDSLYLVVRRTISGATQRHVERMRTRRVADIEDSIFVDDSLSTDGTNTNLAHTMTLSGGTTWLFTETLTLTSSTAYFASTDVGNEIHLTGSDGTLIRFAIEAFSSTTVVTGKPNKTVPVPMRTVAISVWGKALHSITGLWHIEGKQISILGDGLVVASPNNAAYPVYTVTNGAVTFATGEAYVVIHAGLPITSDFRTLNIESVNGETLSDKHQLIRRVTLFVESSRGIWIGPNPPTDDDDDPLEGLYEVKIRNEEGYDDPVNLKTGIVDVTIRSEWSSGGSFFLRQVDPLPLSVLSVAPEGFIPFKR